MSKSSAQNKKSISDLPTEYLFELFSNYLDFNSKLEAEKVCKQWQQIMRMSFDSKRCLIISDYDLHESRLKSLILSNRKISVVKMVSSPIERNEIKDKEFISMVLKKHSNLKTLCICLKFAKWDNKCLDLISKSCSSSLMNLRIEMSDNSFCNRTLIISHEEVLQMAEKLPNLKYFYIDFVFLFIREQSLKTMLKEWHNIETIIFHMPCFRGSVYNSELEHTLSTEFSGDYFSEMSPSMSKLELPGNILSLEAIQRIPEKNNLKRLNISQLRLNSIDMICQKFPELNYFGFTLESSINDDDLYHLMENVGQLHQLEQLYIAIASNVSINYNCIRFLQSCLHLNTLKIDQTLVDKSGIDAITRFFSKLQNLELWTSGLSRNFNHHLTDPVIVNLRKLNVLKSLNIRGQRNISDGSIANIISNCGQLESIDIRSTKAAIITLKVLTEKSNKSDKTTEVFVSETPISRLFGSEFKRYLLCQHLLLINEEYDYKIHF